MKDSRIVASREENCASEKSNSEAEAETGGEDVEGGTNVLCPSKPSHIKFGRSTVKPNDLELMKKLGYIRKNDEDLIRFAGDEVILDSKENEVVVFKRLVLVRGDNI
jgi:hypothetical protein